MMHLDTDGVTPGIINSNALALNAGIDAVISQEVPTVVKFGSPYRNLISVRAETEDGEKITVSGSILGTEAHIVQVNDYKEFPAMKIEGTALVMFKNYDKPGAISSLLSTLAKHNINVGGFTLGKQEDDKALCMMTLDDVVNDEVFNELKDLEQIYEVKRAAFI